MATCLLYAEGGYKGGNGTLLRKEIIGNKTIEIRKFEISNYEAGLYLSDNEPIYDDYIKKNKIGTLKKDKKSEYGNCAILDFYEVCFIPSDKEPNRGDLWVKLSDKTITGWVHAYSDEPNPYADDNYAYLGSIMSGSKTYHIRKYNNGVVWWIDAFNSSKTSIFLEVRNMPGKDAPIIAKIKKGTSTLVVGGEGTVHYFNSVAITEEYDDYDIGYWVKIEYEDDKYGWAPNNFFWPSKHGTLPEDIILRDFDFNWM